jgi:hypothetical protein
MPVPIEPVDQPLVAAIADSILARLDPRLDRLERAIMGDETIGHVGIVTRVDRLERTADLAESAHRDLDEQRKGSVARVHDRMEAVEKDIRADLRRLENRVNRFLWISAGVGIGSGLGAGWISHLLTP